MRDDPALDELRRFAQTPPREPVPVAQVAHRASRHRRKRRISQGAAGIMLVVLVAGGMAVGVGAGQQNRVDPGELAVRKAAGRAKGGAAASDAFFPFRDGLDVLVGAGVSAVIQPGGSVRDEEVIAAANEHGMAMVFTGQRHFRH
jgi:hypothetical protein